MAKDSGPYFDISSLFSTAEISLLSRATVDDMLAPAGTMGALIPENLRARFMAEVLNKMKALPLPDDANIKTDPQ